MSHALLVTVPNNKESASSTFRTISPYVKEKDLGRPYKFDTPDLVVGTLDSLMILSDDLNKIGLQVEVSITRRLFSLSFFLLFPLSLLECCQEN